MLKLLDLNQTPILVIVALRRAIATQNTNLLFSPECSEFADTCPPTTHRHIHTATNTSPVFNYLCPSHPPSHLEYECRGSVEDPLSPGILVKSRPCLSATLSNWLRPLFFLRYEGVTPPPRQHPSSPLCLWLGSPAPVTPIRIGSLAAFTEPSSTIIELVRLCGSHAVGSHKSLLFFIFCLCLL